MLRWYARRWLRLHMFCEDVDVLLSLSAECIVDAVVLGRGV